MTDSRRQQWHCGSVSHSVQFHCKSFQVKSSRWSYYSLCSGLAQAVHSRVAIASQLRLDRSHRALHTKNTNTVSVQFPVLMLVLSLSWRTSFSSENTWLANISVHLAHQVLLCPQIADLRPVLPAEAGFHVKHQRGRVCGCGSDSTLWQDTAAASVSGGGVGLLLANIRDALASARDNLVRRSCICFVITVVITAVLLDSPLLLRRAIARRKLRAPCRKRFFFLCLSRACLGKVHVFMCKLHQIAPKGGIRTAAARSHLKAEGCVPDGSDRL